MADSLASGSAQVDEAWINHFLQYHQARMERGAGAAVGVPVAVPVAVGAVWVWVLVWVVCPQCRVPLFCILDQARPWPDQVGLGRAGLG